MYSIFQKVTLITKKSKKMLSILGNERWIGLKGWKGSRGFISTIYYITVLPWGKGHTARGVKKKDK